jgi:hypothetical protein
MNKPHKIFDHSFKLYSVLRNRAQFLNKGYESLKNNEFKDFPDLWQGPAPENAHTPIEVAFNYSTLVFHMSALEAWFLNLFINSAHLYETRTKNKLKGARDIIRRKIKAKNNVDFLTLSDHHKELVSASFSNLNAAKRLFSEIYGKDCFSHAVGKEEYEIFRKQHEQWNKKRNGIVHRGGEGTSKDFITISNNEIKDFEKSSLLFVGKFTEWCSQNI